MVANRQLKYASPSATPNWIWRGRSDSSRYVFENVSVLVSVVTMHYNEKSGTSGNAGGFHTWIEFLSRQTKTPRGVRS